MRPSAIWPMDAGCRRGPGGRRRRDCARRHRLPARVLVRTAAGPAVRRGVAAESAPAAGHPPGVRTLIVGIGALGGTIATRAMAAGLPVWLATRTPESARA